MGFLILLLVVGIVLALVLPRVFRKMSPEIIQLSRDETDQLQKWRQKYRHKEEYEIDEKDRPEFRQYRELESKYQESEQQFRQSRMSPGMASGLGWASRIVGYLLIIISVLGTSLYKVPQHHSAHIKINIGSRNMADGQIIAEAGQKGPQMDIMPPGWHFDLLIKIYADVEIIPDVQVPEGKVLTLIARDGRDKPDGQYFADIWSDDVDKKKMLEDAKYALERDENGNIIRLQKGPQVTAYPPGTYRFNQYLYEHRVDQDITRIKPGEVGVMKFNYGGTFDHRLLSDTTSEYYDLFADYLTVGNRPVKEVAVRAKSVPDGWKPTKEHPNFDYALLDDPKSKWYQYFPEVYNTLTREMVAEAKLVPPGYQGVCWDVLTEGKYALNPEAVEVFSIETKVQTLNYYGGFTVSEKGVDFDKAYKLEPGQADVATDAISKDGFRMFIEFRILAKVTKVQAPYAFVMWGDWVQIEDKNITPDARSIMRNNAQNASCLDYFRQREQQEIYTFEKMWESQLRKGITCTDVNYGEIRIDPTLLATQTRKVLAEQNKLAWIAEQSEQEEARKMAEKKAQADQQPELVKAQIAKQQAKLYKDEQELRGQGDANYAREFAAGQKALYQALAEVIGPENFAVLEQLKLLHEMGVTNITPMFYYQGGGINGAAEQMSLLQGTILSGALVKGYDVTPADFMPAEKPSVKEVQPKPEPKKKVEPEKKKEQPRSDNKGK